MEKHEWPYPKLLALRKRLPAPEGYRTLAYAGLDDYITPPQQTAFHRTGIALVGKHFLDAKTAKECRDAIVGNGGFCPCVPFRERLEEALGRVGLCLGQVYVTQAFHFLPEEDRSDEPPAELLHASFNAITKHELRGRTVIALGGTAARACRKAKIPRIQAPHPARRRGGHNGIVSDIECSLEEALRLERARRAGGDC